MGGAEDDDARLPPGPGVDPVSGRVTFVVDAEPGVRLLRVWFHLREFGADPTFRRRGEQWVATIPAPPVDRMEYLLVVAEGDEEELVLDPANPRRVAGVFGDHSVLELAGYRAPEWLDAPPAQWSSQPVRTGTSVDVQGELRSPAGADAGEPLPLLVVHDGPEYARLARLLDHLAWLAARDPALRCRALLLQPGDRNPEYAANPRYAQALVEVALPRARELAVTVGRPVGLGASLGALSLLHAAVTWPGTFGGLFLQSGSFFVPRYDAHERGFAFYDRVVDFVAGVDVYPGRLAGLEVAMTSGTGEENLDNNRALAERLRSHDVPTVLTEGRDDHSYTAWRDLLDPTLRELLARVWRFPSGG